VTHEADVARFAHRVLRFRDGRLVEDRANGKPDDAQAMLRAESIPLARGAQANA